MGINEIIMQRALELAGKHLATVRANPMVGAVVVKDGKVISEGAHEKFGEAHAEINALKSLTKEQTSGADLYVTLEPCCHFGKTPPCTQAIIAAGIKNVFYGIQDPNPQVAGKGLKELQAAGIVVNGPLLEQECRFLNRRFITLQEKKRPYIILKWAQSKDGFIAPIPRARLQLSSEESRQLVQRYRSEEMAIMVGTTTCLVDNPRLTSRVPEAIQPLRITIDRHGKLDPALEIFRAGETVLFTGQELSLRLFPSNVTVVSLQNPNAPLSEILAYLASRQILSCMVEGGTDLFSSFIEQDLWDETRIFKTQKSLENGLCAPKPAGTVILCQSSGTDTLEILFSSSRSS